MKINYFSVKFQITEAGKPVFLASINIKQVRRGTGTLSHNVYYRGKKMSTNKISAVTTKAAKEILANGVKRKIFAFNDKAIGFTEIFTQPNEAIAVRLFTDLTNKDNSHFKKYADQMSLWCLGEFNDITGIIENAAPRCILRGEQCLIPEQK